MAFVELVVWLLRAMGVVYAVGGVLVLRQCRLERALGETIDALEAALSGRTPVSDPGRVRWLVAGGVLTIIAGVALVAAHEAAVWTQFALVVHQALYFVRQHRRAKKARDPEESADARPAPATTNAALFSGAVLVVVLFVARTGALTPLP